MKVIHSIQTPIGYAIAGSFFLHIILVSMYATLLTSGKIPLAPPPPKKFKIEMVAKKSKPVKKFPVVEKKARQNKVVKQLMSPIIPAKPKIIQENNVHPLKQSFRVARADISANAVIAKPRMIENFQTLEIITPKVPRSSTGKTKPADISPLPRPVENVRIFSKVTGKETRFHASAAGFASSIPKPKSVSVTSFSLSGERATARIHNVRKNIAHGLPRARTIATAKTQGADQKRAVEFKSGVPSRSLAPALATIRPSAPKYESGKIPDRSVKFYEANTLTVSTLPSARVPSVAPSSNRTSGNNRRTEFVQKGNLIAAATIPTPRPVPNIIDKGILDDYLGTLQAMIASAKKYPESARKSGQEGKVTVQFTVMKNGNVKNIQLVSKTNYPDLNEEAIEAVKRAAPFSSLPDEMDKPFLDIILPFRFKLNE